MSTPSDRVMKRVRWCKMHNMNKPETMEYLAWRAKIDPASTERVWEMLSEETPQELKHHQNLFNQQVDNGLAVYPISLAFQLTPHNNQIMPQHYRVSDGDGDGDGDDFDEQPPMHAKIGSSSHQYQQPPQNRHVSGSHEALINGLNGNIRPQHMERMPHFHVPSHGHEQTIDRVRWLIVDCIMKYMTKSETMELLERQESIDRSLAQAVWEVWESANPRFFRAYYIRMAVKNQIQRFNNLLERQVHAMQ